MTTGWTTEQPRLIRTHFFFSKAPRTDRSTLSLFSEDTATTAGSWHTFSAYVNNVHRPNCTRYFLIVHWLLNQLYLLDVPQSLTFKSFNSALGVYIACISRRVRKLRKVAGSLVVSVCPPSMNNSDPIRTMFKKSYIWVFFKNLSAKVMFD